MKELISNILFVCTGNSCRSIMAEGYLRKRVAEEGLQLDVASAGTIGMNGAAPTKEALKILESEKVSTKSLMSKRLSEEYINWADLILVMEPEHKSIIVNMVPQAADKIHYLGEFNPEQGDIVIPDPIGRPLAFYRASFRLIKGSTEGFIKWLKKSQ